MQIIEFQQNSVWMATYYKGRNLKCLSTFQKQNSGKYLSVKIWHQEVGTFATQALNFDV